MNNRTRALALVAAGALFGVGAGIVAGAALGANQRPIWNYHNGNTLLAHTADYRNGYFIGVVDGYAHAHMRLADHGEDGVWLDRCLSGGWTVGRTTRVMAEHLETSVPRLWDPAADILLDGLKNACAKGSKGK